jgi:hypothetical protein
MEEMYAKHGEVFTIPLLHKKMTFLIGPHASPHFFNATDDKMSQTEVSPGRSHTVLQCGCRCRGAGMHEGMQAAVTRRLPPAAAPPVSHCCCFCLLTPLPFVSLPACLPACLPA